MSTGAGDVDEQGAERTIINACDKPKRNTHKQTGVHMNQAYMGFYAHYQEVYNTTKPIRGKEIRPIGQRRRTHETIRAIVQPDGTTAYAARMYDTDCVTFYPNGMFDVSSGGWNTPTTADFILRVFQQMKLSYHGGHSIYALKSRNKVWLCDRSDGPNYPLDKEPIRFYLQPGNPAMLKPTTEIKLKVRRADRKATALIYKSMQPFLDWVRTFIAMSDGWLMHETRLTVTPMRVATSDDHHLAAVGMPIGGYEIPEVAPSGKKIPGVLRNANKYTAWSNQTREDKEAIVNWLTELHEDDYLLTYAIFGVINDSGNSYRTNTSPDVRLVKEYPSNHKYYVPRYYDVKQDFTALKRVIQKVVTSMAECQKTVEVEPSRKFINNVA